MGFRLVDIPGIPHIGVFGRSFYIYEGSTCKALLGAGRLKLDSDVCIVRICLRITYQHDPAPVALCGHAFERRCSY